MTWITLSLCLKKAKPSVNYGKTLHLVLYKKKSERKLTFRPPLCDLLKFTSAFRNVLSKRQSRENVKRTLSPPHMSHNQRVKAMHLLHEAYTAAVPCCCFFPCVTSPWSLPSWWWVSIWGCLSHRLVAWSICSGICCSPRPLHGRRLADISWLISSSSGYPEHTHKRGD